MSEEQNIQVSLSEIARMDKMLNDDIICPCTIVQDRYGGTYSEASWLAFNREPEYIPEQVGGGDNDEMEFWDSIEWDCEWIGKGNTPNEAVLDLRRKIQKKFEPKEPETKLYEVWTEGYAATGERAGAMCHTILENGQVYKTRARSFIEACELVLGDDLDRNDDGSLRLSHQHILTQDGLIQVPMIWACRCFDNEQRARKSFG